MAVFQALQPGDHVIVPKDMYMGIQHMLRQVLTRWQLDFSFVNMDRLEDYLRPEIRLIWIETPSTPMMKVTSIPRIVELARRRKIITVVDDTFPTPVFPRLIALGVDLVMISH